MKLNVPTNWDDRLIDELGDSSVYSVYGMLNHAIVGGGRPSRAIPDITRKEAEKHIEKVRSAGLRFNYVLNAPCMGNQEFSANVKKEILEYVAWIYGSGVNSVTVSIPYIVDLVIKHFPKLEVVASVFSGIDSVRMVEHFEKQGIRHMVVEQALNRNIPALKKLVRSDVDLQVIVNNGCLFECPYRRYHANINAHASQTASYQSPMKIDYTVLNCSKIRFSSPVEFIKSPWVRPEDLHYYEDIGIHTFKISGRTKSTDWIADVARAYTRGKYSGNLAEILAFPYDESALSFDPPLAIPKLYIDNSKLEGFFGFFLKNDCRLISCEDCGHCGFYADRSMFWESGSIESVIERYKKVLEQNT